MRTSGPPLLAAALLAFVFLPGFAQTGLAQTKNPAQLQANRVADRVSAGVRVALPGHLAPAWTRASNDLGSVPDGSRIPLIFALSRAPEVQAAFEQMLDDQQNPNSSRYHQWLTPAQIGEQFGPTQHDVDALTGWLTSAGFTVDGVTPSRTFVQVSAPAAVISAALGTSLHTYSVVTGLGPEVRQAPTSEPLLPAALAPIVAYIGGLTSMPEHVHSHVTTHTVRAVADGAGSVHPDLTAGMTTYFLSPKDFNKIYDVPAGITGTGENVAIIGGSRLDPNDLSLWEKDTALASYTPNYIVGKGFSDPGETMDGSQGEGTLDFERVYGTAPGALVDQVIAANWLNGTVNQNLVLYAINTVNDPVMSLSFGACEVEEPAGFVKTEDSMYSQAAAQGISVLVSSGDSGVAGCEAHGAAPPATQIASISDICATSYVTCVGGTEFNDASNYAAYWSTKNAAGFFSALGYIPEGVWNEPSETTTAANGTVTTTTVVAASGGGPSTIITKPAFQTGTGVPADGFRDTPDISFSASGHDGYFACLASSGGDCVPDAQGFISFVAFSGTSASAPSMAGVAALVVQKLNARQGNLNPTLYRLAASTPGAFHDATIATSGVSGCTAATPSMCNNSDPAPAAQAGGLAGYLLQTGYDLVTGLGSLDVNAFLTAASATALPSTTSALTASPATITTAQTVVFTDIVSTAATTGAPMGTVTFTTNSGLNLGTVALAANTTTNSETAATAALSFPAAGTYIVTATYGGSATFAASSATATLVVSVPALPATTTTLTGTTGTITALTPVSYTAAVAPTATNTLAPGGNVQFLRTSSTGASANLGAAVTVVGGKATLTGVTIPVGSYTVTAVYQGDTNFAGSTSNGLGVVSTSVATTTMLTGVPATATSTTTFTASATVVSSTGGGTPTGTVQFSVDAANYGAAVALPATGTATASVTLAGGTHTVCATYAGDTTFASSTTTPCKTVTVTATPVTASLTAATTTPYSYQTDVLTVTYTGTAANVAAPSMTTFTDVFTPVSGTVSTTTLGTASSGTTGSASLTVGPLGVGTHKVTATYPGDTVYSAATSNTITLTVAAATITLAPANTALMTAAGTTVTDSITLTDANYAGNENLACTVVYNGTGGATNVPVCTISPASLTLSGTGASSATISLSSVKGSAVTGGNFAGLRTLTGLGGATLCGLFALFVPRRRRLRQLRGARLVASFVVLAGTLMALGGCGSNNFSGTRVAGTTAGSYTVTVTAASTFVSGSTTVSLTVQ